ncbi:hypothetical protein BVX97_05290 [bacterium E08(2017)]|nr:hypothetical protein BVX97_05290 [bacterium E08(2017)]
MRRLILIFLMMISAYSATFGDNTGENTFIWNEANDIMFRARTPEEFTKAAEAYSKLLKRDIHNGHLLYNIGTALTLAGHYEMGADYLERAEMFMGTTWEIERNLSLAYALGDSSKVTALPWYRYPLFWHFNTPLNMRIAISVAAYLLFWLSLSLFAACPKSLSKGLLVISLVLLVLFGSSAATSIHQELSAPALKVSKLAPPFAEAQEGVMY